MLRLLACLVLALPFVLCAAGAQDDEVEALIKKLGSSTAKEREDATKALKSRPEAAEALLRATKSTDPEVARRANLILGYFEQLKLAEITAAAKEGRVGQLIDLVVELPEGKNEQFLHDTLKAFAKKLSDKHVRAGGKEIVPQGMMFFGGPVYDLKTQRITEQTPDKATPGEFPGYPVLRANEFDLNYTRLQKGKVGNSFLQTGALIVSRGNVLVKGGLATGLLILAGGDVEICSEGGGLIVVSCGKITWRRSPRGCLVLAQGTISCNDHLIESRFVSGKNVLLTGRAKKAMVESSVTENERNPLGFIRWDARETEKKKDQK